MFKKMFLRVLFLVMIFILTTFLSFGLAETSIVENNEKIFSIKIDKGEGKIAYTGVAFSDSEKYGPESFAVSDSGDFYILDTIEKQVEIFSNKGEYKYTIYLPENKGYNDIEIIDDNSFVVLTYDGEVFEYKDGLLKEQYQVLNNKTEREIIFVKLSKNKNNVPVIWDLVEGCEIEIMSGKKANSLNSTEIYKNGNKTTLLFDDQVIEIEYTFVPAGTYPLKLTNDNELLVEEKEALVGKGLYVETRIGKFKNSKRIGSALALPTVDYYTKVPKKFLYAAKNGDIYQMVCLEDSIDIYKLGFSKDIQTNIDMALLNKVKNISFPEDSKNIGIMSLTAFNRGLDMCEYEWYYNPSTMKTPSTSTTEPPEHLTGSSPKWEEGIPYRWGGMNGLDTYKSGYTSHIYTNYIDGLNDGRTAGDINFSYIDPSTVGVDCSGFICAAYKIYPKLNTAGMSSEFYNIDWDDISKGDIGNIPYFHVWMFERNLYDIYGNWIAVYTLESTTDGSEDKAKEWGRMLDDALRYNPMRRR